MRLARGTLRRSLLCLAVGLAALTWAAGAPAWPGANGMIGFTHKDPDGFSGAFVNADGSGFRLGTVERSAPVFSPDGNRILTFSFNGAGASGLYVSDVDGQNAHPLTTSTPGNIWDAAWSPDGTRIAYTLSGFANGADSEV